VIDLAKFIDVLSNTV